MMMKTHILYLTICSLAHTAYISRMSTNRIKGPTPFRPGFSMQRPWMQTRLVQAASNRAPYVVYRHPPHRYAVKHYAQSPTRTMFGGGSWKTSRLPPPLAPSTPEYEFVKAASAQPEMHAHGGTGAIHTIPAPNLSLSEKPIIVMDTSEGPASGQTKPIYEVTETYQEQGFNMPKLETPAGFSKATSLTSPELQTLIRNGAALQIASEFGYPINVPQAHVVSQQYPVQGFSGLPTQQDLVNTGAEGIFIPPNPLMQSDPMFFEKLQNQLLQRFPAVEFIHYPADMAPQVPNQVHFEVQGTQNYPQGIIQPQTYQNHAQTAPNTQAQNHPQMILQAQESQIHPQIIMHNQATQTHPQVIIVEDHNANNQQVPQTNDQKTVVQRETIETSQVTSVPQSYTTNVTEKQEITTIEPQHNITLELLTSEVGPETTTMKYVIERKAEEQSTTPIYYAQVGQSIGNLIANGFYSAINDVRAAAAISEVAQSEKNNKQENVTTTTMGPKIESFFVRSESSDNKTSELKPLLGVPFKKLDDAVDVTYTLRAVDKEPKVTQEGAVYAGQIVEATISEDHDFNQEKANLISKRAPIRLYTVSDIKEVPDANTNPVQKVTVVKAKIPPKSKLTFDDKTGEPILRIYASYVDNPAQKEAVVTKLATLKQAKEPTKKEIDSWKGPTVKSADKAQGFEANQVTQFGLKLRSRSDDYIPVFEEYED